MALWNVMQSSQNLARKTYSDAFQTSKLSGGIPK